MPIGRIAWGRLFAPWTPRGRSEPLWNGTSCEYAVANGMQMQCCKKNIAKVQWRLTSGRRAEWRQRHDAREEEVEWQEALCPLAPQKQYMRRSCALVTSMVERVLCTDRCHQRGQIQHRRCDPCRPRGITTHGPLNPMHKVLDGAGVGSTRHRRGWGPIERISEAW